MQVKEKIDMQIKVEEKCNNGEILARVKY